MPCRRPAMAYLPMAYPGPTRGRAMANPRPIHGLPGLPAVHPRPTRGLPTAFPGITDRVARHSLPTAHPGPTINLPLTYERTTCNLSQFTNELPHIIG